MVTAFVRHSNTQRLSSRLLTSSTIQHDPTFKAEALTLSDEVGPKAAAELLKMSLNTLKGWRRARKKAQTTHHKTPSSTPAPQEGCEGAHPSCNEEDPEMSAAFEGLNPRQREFVRRYCAGPTRFNGVRSAEAAGYGGDEATLAGAASRLRRKDKIKRAISVLLRGAHMSTDEMMSRLEDHANVNMDDFGSLDSEGEWQWDLRKAAKRGCLHLIEEIQIETTEVVDPDDRSKILRKKKVRLKLMSRRFAHKDLAQAQKLINEGDTQNITVNITADDMLASVAKAKAELEAEGYDV